MYRIRVLNCAKFNIPTIPITNIVELDARIEDFLHNNISRKSFISWCNRKKRHKRVSSVYKAIANFFHSLDFVVRLEYDYYFQFIEDVT